jgi:Undecaprenyl-phosphate glucose phosphotransferase
MSGAAKIIRSGPRIKPRMAVTSSEDHANIPRRSRHRVASRYLHSPLQACADSAVIVLLSVATGVAYHQEFLNETGPIGSFVYTGAVVAVLFAGIARLVSVRHAATLTSGTDRLRDAALVWNLTFAALVLLLFSLKAGQQFSRGAVFFFYLIGLPAIGAWRVFVPPLLARVLRKAGTAARECIVIGDGEDKALDEFVSELAEEGRPVPTVIKFHARCQRAAWNEERERLIARAISAAHALRHGEIYLCATGVPADRLASIQRGLTLLPRAIYVVPDAETSSLLRCKPSNVGSHLAVEVRSEPFDPVQRTIKRLVDFVVALVAIVFLAPFFCVVALAIRLDSPGPDIFRQTRNGYRGKPFRIFKLRTMKVQEDGPAVRQASRDDSRVTRVGRFLRKTSIDELPQLLNVLMGQMSLVGPRPHAQAHDDIYARTIENYEVRQHVKPGVTGWAQVNGLRGETATLDLMYKRIEYDLWYAVHASLLLDAEILARTVFEVARQRNAY